MSLRGTLMRTRESWQPAHLPTVLHLGSGSSGREGLCAPEGAVSAWGALLGVFEPSCEVVYLGGREPALGGCCYLGWVSCLSLLGLRSSPELRPPDPLPPSCLPWRRGVMGRWRPGRLEKVEGQLPAPLL